MTPKNTNFYAITDYVLHHHFSEGQAGEHYDLRIKYPNKNMLASWALPKAEVPKKDGERVLAVKVNDHSRLWLYFEGTVEEGYGAGKIKIVQKGKMEIYGWGPQHITFYVQTGKYMRGKYSLIRFKAKEKNTDTWVLLKAREA